jgi:hypothetical protein
MKSTLVWFSLVFLAIGCVRLQNIGSPKPASEPSEPEAIVVNGVRYTEADLESLRSMSFIRVMEKMGLEGCDFSCWVDEPPGELRGMMFCFSDRVSVTLYVDYAEPVFKAPTDRGKWDCGAVFLAKVGGVTVSSEGTELDVGNVPWQWLPLRKRK